MKINELTVLRSNTAYAAGQAEGDGDFPAAALWVVRPLPPPEVLLCSDEIIQMKKENRPKNVGFWLSLKKARVQAKDANTTVGSHFLEGAKRAARNSLLGSQQQPVTFQGAMRGMLAAGQAFGLNPVQGILSDDASKLRFSLVSWRCAYALLSLAGQSVVVVLCVIRCVKSKLDFSSGTSVVFYGGNCLTTALFVRVAARWPELCRYISRSERAEPCVDTKLRVRCNFTVIIILFLALMEHVFSIIAGVSVAKDCEPERPLYEALITGSFPWVFDYFTYNTFVGAITQFLNLQSTFNWSFTDLFVICISYYLTSRFEQVNRRIYAVRGKYMPSSFWRTAREDYCRNTQLVRRVDGVISAIVFVSFANNLYFICLQLFHTLEDGIKGTPQCRDRKLTGPLGGHEHAVYFVYSFAYLLLRSLAVSLLVARIHSSARAPAPVLYDVPSPVYCVEVQRFLEQTTADTVALSGLQFFNVTRGLVLTIAGTIVTYELVLVQFNDPGPSPLRTPPALLPAANLTPP